MSIEAITVPPRSRVWSEEDAKQAYDLLVGNEDEGRAPQAVKYGEYENEGKARTQGMALDRMIEAKYGRRFGVSVWKGEDGKYVGALLTRPPVQRKASNGNGKPAARKGSRSK